MERVIDHTQITVRDMEVAVPLYDTFLPLLCFDTRSRSAAVAADALHRALLCAQRSAADPVV